MTIETDKSEELVSLAAGKAIGVLDVAAGRAVGVLDMAADRAAGVVATAATLATTALSAMTVLAQRRFRWSMYLLAVLILTVGLGAGVVVHFYAQHTTDQATIVALKTKNASLGHSVITLNKSLGADHRESVQLFCSLLSAVHDTSPVYVRYCSSPPRR